MQSITCSAPVNIAVVKYWGKRDETLILPTNSSLSVTLHQQQMCATTTVAASPQFTTDRMWLNGTEENLQTPRLQNVLKEIRRRAEHLQNGVGGSKLHICSKNNFPTAAGLASSAAGYACLVYALAKLYHVEGDISEIARQGSGSACRSVYGGFVEWSLGEAADGSDSLAHQVAPETHWPELHVLVLVVSGKKKHIGSTAGMQTSVLTSALMQHRIKRVVPARMNEMRQAILDKDFQTFSELTIKDSNSMHAVCLDTYPPVTYMTDVSRDITRMVHAINQHYKANKVAYTFDAGPNACLYVCQRDVPMVISLIQHFFPPTDQSETFIQGLSFLNNLLHAESCDVDGAVRYAIPLSPQPGGVQYVIHTAVGPGPQVLPEASSLLGQDGLPTT